MSAIPVLLPQGAAADELSEKLGSSMQGNGLKDEPGDRGQDSFFSCRGITGALELTTALVKIFSHFFYLSTPTLKNMGITGRTLSPSALASDCVGPEPG